MFNGNTHYKWPLSMAILVYQRGVLTLTMILGYLVGQGEVTLRQILGTEMSRVIVLFYSSFVGFWEQKHTSGMIPGCTTVFGVPA